MNKQELATYIENELNLLAKQENLLVLSSNYSSASVFGIKTTQKTNGCTLFTPKGSFAEVASSSQFLKHAFRVYDDYNGNVKVYDGKEIDTLWKEKPKTYDYDDFILHYGKLNQKEYFVHPQRLRPKDIIREVYASKEDETTKKRQNIIIQEIHANSISAVKMVDDKHIFIKLKPSISHQYYSIQIKNNGNFDSYPDISECSVEFLLDENNHINKMLSHEIYQARFGLMTIAIDSNTTTSFIKKIDDVYIINNKEKHVSIPDIKEILNIYK